MKSAFLGAASLLLATSSFAADAAKELGSKDPPPNATLTINGISRQVTLMPLKGARQEVRSKPTKAPPRPPASLHLGTKADLEQHAPPVSPHGLGPHHKLVDQYVGFGWRGGGFGVGWRAPWYGGGYGGGYGYYSRPFYGYSTPAYYDVDGYDGYYDAGYAPAPICTCQY